MNITDRQDPGFFLNKTSFDLKHIIDRYIRFWPIFLISILLFLFIAFLYLRYTTPTYSILSKILIKSDNRKANSADDILTDVDLLITRNNVAGENEILKTANIIEEVVDKLDLNVRYFSQGRFHLTELYKNTPFKVVIISPKDGIPTGKLSFHIVDRTSFTISSSSINGKFNYNDTIKTPEITFTVKPQFFQGYYAAEDYIVDVNDKRAVTDFYKNAILSSIDEQANMIVMQLVETVPEKGKDILNTLYEVYTKVNEENKNKMADSTISFIDNRLGIISVELSGVEKDIEEFKKSNEAPIDIQEQARQNMGQSNEIQSQLLQKQVQLEMIESIEIFVKNKTGRIIPGIISDPTYGSIVQKYNNLVMEKDRQLETTKPDNPVVVSLENQIETLQKDLLVSLDNAKREINISRNQLQSRNNEFLRNIRTTPTKERSFLDISRQQSLKQELYLYLLQKREQTAISKTGSLANSRLIEPARSSPVPLSPNETLIYCGAVGAGIVLPVLFLFALDFFNNKIRDKKDITSITSVPILGEIGHNNSKKLIVFKPESRTFISEQFRLIRANLHFIFHEKQQKVFMITSSISGEGKTFFSLNMSSSFAIAGKKTVLLELDLRKPEISHQLGLSNDRGFTDYMVSDITKEELAKSTTIHPNLYVISSGTVPINPGELLLQEKMGELFNYLKSEFDYIIIDTPPFQTVHPGTQKPQA